MRLWKKKLFQFEKEYLIILKKFEKSKKEEIKKLEEKVELHLSELDKNLKNIQENNLIKGIRHSFQKNYEEKFNYYKKNLELIESEKLKEDVYIIEDKINEIEKILDSIMKFSEVKNNNAKCENLKNDQKKNKMFSYNLKKDENKYKCKNCGGNLEFVSNFKKYLICNNCKFSKLKT